MHVRPEFVLMLFKTDLTLIETYTVGSVALDFGSDPMSVLNAICAGQHHKYSDV